MIAVCACRIIDRKERNDDESETINRTVFSICTPSSDDVFDADSGAVLFVYLKIRTAVRNPDCI